MNMIKTLAAGAAILSALTLGGTALAFDTSNFIPVPSGTAEIEAVNALMAPIAPLMTGVGGNTNYLAQFGTGNQATASIVGQGSASILQQSGINNRAVQAIEGSGSGMILQQAGENNTVLQASVGDRNFQYVGVSGTNNDVAYVQVGDDLRGALDVTNSHNTTVVSVQTPSTSNYMMPSGISNSSNALIIVVPGRMYVFDKSKL